MSFEFIKKLPTPQEIREKYPLSEELAAIKKARDEEIRKVFTGESDKFLVIIGPCSADNEEAVLDYAGRLAKVNEKVGDKLILIPRIYTSCDIINRNCFRGYRFVEKPAFGIRKMKSCIYRHEN